MKRSWLWICAGVVSLIATLSLAGQQADSGQAQSNLANSFSSSVPRLVKFSGALKDLTGKLLTGPVEISFAIYKEQADAAPLWQEAQTLALDEQGRYTVLLGAMQTEGLPLELFASGGVRWLGIQAPGAEAQPRVLLVSVPYALKAGDAETLSGKPVSDFVLAQQLKEQVQTEVAQQAKKQPDRGQQALAMVLSQGPTPMVTSQGQTSFSCPTGTTGDCVTVTQSSTGRALVAVANSSAEALRVTQNGTGYGLLAMSSGSGVYGVSTATTGTVYGIRGDSASTGGRGILGFATATTGGTIGLWGNAASTGGTGVLGDATATTGYTYGLRGRSYSSSGTGILAYAMATTGTTKGLWAQVYSADGTAAVFQNTATSGKLLSGLTGTGTGTEVFSVAGTGNLVSAGTLSGAQLISTAASGTPPLTVASPTLVTNLNADMVDGLHASSLATLGANSFVGNQGITGNLTLSGSINTGLVVQANATSPNLIGGYSGNSVTSLVWGATIGGGGASTYTNRVTDNFGTVGGGKDNQAGDNAGTTSDKAYATVGGGYSNTASGYGATIGGGYSNIASGAVAAILGGEANTASGDEATVGGGDHDTASGTEATVGGGGSNTASSQYASVGGGYGNTASGTAATVPGGSSNTAQGINSFAAGYRAKALHNGAFVWGDTTNADVASTGENQFVVRAIGGAYFSHALLAQNFIGDGSGLTALTAANISAGTAGINISGNAATATTATNASELGGMPSWDYARLDTGNSFSGDQSITGNLTLSGSINGGLVVQARATSPNLVGGYGGNSVTSGVVGATIGGGGAGGYTNLVTDNYGTVGGGRNNQAGDNAGTTSDRPYATVGGGYSNTASGYYTTVGGGYGNIASGTSASVGGGQNNTASGNYATVPGGLSNTAQGSTSFAAGYRAKANDSSTFVWGDSTDADVASTGTNQFIVRAHGGVWFGTTSSPSWPTSSFIATSTGAYLSTGGTWTNNSDRNLKEQFAPVNGLALLARLAELPILTWNYRVEPASNRHIGPIAQDFRAAFGLGEDDKHISTVDADGVALAAIQALYKLSLEKDGTIKAQGQKIEQLEREVGELRARLEQLLKK